MTHSEISNIIGQHYRGGYLALSIAIVELAHADIAKFARLHQKYTKLPALTPYQRATLQRAAIDSAAGRRFLDSGWCTQWATGR